MTFDRFLGEHGPALWRVVASYAPPGAERDDLTQEVLVAVWLALPRHRGQGTLRSFVLRIAHNRGLSHAFRRAPRTPEEEEPAEIVDPRPGAEELAASHQRAEQFLRHVRALPLGQRQVLTLALEGLSHAEIAAIVGITAENVAVRLGRARAALRRSIQHEEAA